MNSRPFQHGSWIHGQTIRRCRVVLGSAALLAMAACQTPPRLPVFGPPGSKLEMTSQFFPDAQVTGEFDTCLYRYDTDNNLTLVMIAGPTERPTGAVTVRMFWRPAAARTPITRDATNMMVRYFVFDEKSQELGVYAGAGFLYLHSTPGQNKLAASIWQATVRLADASDAFDDGLIEARLSGQIIAVRDDAAATAALHRLNTLVTERLGYPRFVRLRGGESILDFGFWILDLQALAANGERLQSH